MTMGTNAANVDPGDLEGELASWKVRACWLIDRQAGERPAHIAQPLCPCWEYIDLVASTWKSIRPQATNNGLGWTDYSWFAIHLPTQTLGLAALPERKCAVWNLLRANWGVVGLTWCTVRQGTYPELTKRGSRAIVEPSLPTGNLKKPGREW